MGICSTICKHLSPFPSDLSRRPAWEEEEIREAELLQVERNKRKNVPILSIQDNFLYRQRKSVLGSSKCDETKDPAF